MRHKFSRRGPPQSEQRIKSAERPSKDSTNRLLLYLFTIAALAIGCSNTAHAQRLGDGDRSITLDTRYHFAEYSNRAFAQFGLDLIDAASVPAAVEDTPLEGVH